MSLVVNVDSACVRAATSAPNDPTTPTHERDPRMRGTKALRGVAGMFAAVALVPRRPHARTTTTRPPPTPTEQSDDSGTTMADDAGAMPASSAEACDAEQITALVQGGQDEGTLEGMTDDPSAPRPRTTRCSPR